MGPADPSKCKDLIVVEWAQSQADLFERYFEVGGAAARGECNDFDKLLVLPTQLEGWVDRKDATTGESMYSVNLD